MLKAKKFVFGCRNSFKQQQEINNSNAFSYTHMGMKQQSYTLTFCQSFAVNGAFLRLPVIITNFLMFSAFPYSDVLRGHLNFA